MRIKRVKQMLILSALICVLSGCSSEHNDLVLSGCSSEHNDLRERETNTAIGVCVDTGGMPVRSMWDGRLENCIYPPQTDR